MILAAGLAVSAIAQVERAALPASPVTAPSAEVVARVPASSAQDWFSIALYAGVPVLLIVLWWTDVIRPGSPRRAGIRQVSPHPWWIWLAAGLLVFMAGQFVGAVVHASLGIPWWIDWWASPPMKAQVLVNGAMAGAGCLAGIAVLRMLDAGAPASGVRARWSDLPVGLWCFVLAYPVVLCISLVSVQIATHLQGQRPDVLAHETLRQLSGSAGDAWAWGMRLTAIILVPAFEEIIYRACLQTALLRASGSPWAAIAGSAAIFTIAHAGVMPGHALAVIAALAVGIGLAYERTKRLGVPIVMHALFNLVNVLMALAASSN